MARPQAISSLLALHPREHEPACRHPHSPTLKRDTDAQSPALRRSRRYQAASPVSSASCPLATWRTESVSYFPCLQVLGEPTKSRRSVRRGIESTDELAAR